MVIQSNIMDLVVSIKSETYHDKSIHYVESAASNWVDGIKGVEWVVMKLIKMRDMLE